MGTSFGFFTKSQSNVTFGNLRARLVSGVTHPNHPDNPDSPNYPRAQRLPGYQNPVLGDAGNGKIGRFQPIKLDALETVIDQLIEQYLRDKSWFGKVRCREALWNMYRRLAWWVEQEIGASRSDYERALQMIKDCIYHILQDAQMPGGMHEGVSLPLCPAPYYEHFSANYFNHFDGQDVEEVLFSLKDRPLQEGVPGHFRYVSSSEEQEWQLVHSVGGDETTGNENILKLDLHPLYYGNSSKLSLSWRFKRNGCIRFQYFASAAAGNGLLFFINGEQVGGEWNKTSTWQEVRFNVSPGQTYKFDWFVRKQAQELWGENAIYIKDIECVEVIKSFDPPAPPDFDTQGSAVFDTPNEWLMFSTRSIIRTEFIKDVPADHNTKTYVAELDNECTGDLSFQYRMTRADTSQLRDYSPILIDQYASKTQHGVAEHGSSADSLHDDNWVLDGGAAGEHTKANGAKVTYTITAGKDVTNNLAGVVRMTTPPKQVDTYKPFVYLNGLANMTVSSSGNIPFVKKSVDPYGWVFAVADPAIVQGFGTSSVHVTMNNDGWMTFSLDQKLRPTETFNVFVNGDLQYTANGTQNLTDLQVPLTKGDNVVDFTITDSATEVTFSDVWTYHFNYFKGPAAKTVLSIVPQPNGVTVDRHFTTYGGYGMFDGDYGDTTMGDQSGSWQDIDITLAPGSWCDFSEQYRLRSFILPLDSTNYWDDGSRGPVNELEVYGDPTQSNYLDPIPASLLGWTSSDPNALVGGPILGISFARSNWAYQLTTEVRSRYPVTIQGAWKWQDLYERYGITDPNNESHGALIVENADYTTNTITFENVPFQDVMGGYVTFRYGGDFNEAEHLNLYMDDELLWWTDTNYNNPDGKFVAVPVPQGTHTFRFEYQDLGGTVLVPQPVTIHMQPDSPPPYIPPLPDSGGGSTDGNGTTWDTGTTSGGSGTGQVSSDPTIYYTSPSATCWYGGQQTYPIDYSKWNSYNNRPDGDKRGAIFDLSGKNHYLASDDGSKNYVKTVISSDGSEITRTIECPDWVTVDYEESLYVFLGGTSSAPVTGTSDVVKDLRMYYHGTIQQNLPNSNFPTSTTFVLYTQDKDMNYNFLYTEAFDVRNYAKVYYEHMEQLFAGPFGIDGYDVTTLRARATAHVFLVPNFAFHPSYCDIASYQRAGYEIYTYGEGDHYINSVRTLDQAQWNYINDTPSFSASRCGDIISQNGNGLYRFVFCLKDNVTDRNLVKLGGVSAPYFFAMANIQVETDGETVTTPGVTTYDNTYVEVITTDLKTGQPVPYSSGHVPGSADGARMDWTYQVKPGQRIQIKYKLHGGGRLECRNGTFKESWGVYCMDTNGNMYKPDDPLNPGGGGTGGDTGGGTGGTGGDTGGGTGGSGGDTNPPPPPPGYDVVIVPPADSFVWINGVSFYVDGYDALPTYPDTEKENQHRVVMELLDDTGQVVGSCETAQVYDIDQKLGFHWTNTSSTLRTWKIRVMHYQALYNYGNRAGTARVFDGTISIGTPQPLPESHLTVYNVSAWDSNPIYMGGGGATETGSKMRVYIHTDDGRTLYDQTYIGDGIYSYSVTDLDDLTYPKYTVEITTEQHGQVSIDTGKSYETTFYTQEFGAYEDWRLQPNPFNGKLEFFVDDILMRTYTADTPNWAQDVVTGIEPGKHKFKWVFTEQNTENTFDFCEIDYVQLTNWICGDVKVTPYCEPGGGDKCIEALIQCLLHIWKNRPQEGVVIGKKIWLFT